MPACSASAMACMSLTSSCSRATAAGHTFIIKFMAFSGVFAMLSATRQCACVGVAQQFRALRAQAQDFGDNFLVVVRIAVVAAAVVGAPNFLAQISPVRIGQE